jgi:hypothetical protein
MTRARLEHVPAVPHDINDVSIRGLWKRIWSEDRFLLYKDNDWGILIYATNENFIVTKHFVHVHSHISDRNKNNDVYVLVTGV